MIVYQCVRCSRREVMQPRRCAGCGGRTFGAFDDEPSASSDGERREPGSPSDEALGSLVELTPMCKKQDGSRICIYDAGHPGPHSWGHGERSPQDLADELGGAECSQDGCEQAATHRFTWPGNPEQRSCAEHAEKARGVANAMGFSLEVVPL